MLLEGLRGYLQLVSGLTDVTRERATAVARSLLSQGEAGVDAVVSGPAGAQVSALTDELLTAARANRELLKGLVRAEVQRAVGRAGLSLRAELEAANRHTRDLEDRVHELERDLRTARAAAATPEAAQAAAKKTASRKASAKKSAAKKSAARKTAARKTAAQQSTEKQSAPSNVSSAPPVPAEGPNEPAPPPPPAPTDTPTAEPTV